MGAAPSGPSAKLCSPHLACRRQCRPLKEIAFRILAPPCHLSIWAPWTVLMLPWRVELIEVGASASAHSTPLCGDWELLLSSVVIRWALDMRSSLRSPPIAFAVYLLPTSTPYTFIQLLSIRSRISVRPLVNVLGIQSLFIPTFALLPRSRSVAT